MKKIITFVSVLFAVNQVFAQQTWTLDKNNSSLGFTVKHLTISEVTGSIRRFDIKLTSTGEDFSDVSVEVTGWLTSIDTGNENRDNDLKSDHFFDVKDYPDLHFESTSFKKTGDKEYILTGNLTMHGITGPVLLNVTFNGTIQQSRTQKTIAGFRVTGVLKRSDFNIGPGMPVFVVSDEVNILSNLEFIKD